MSTVAVSHIPWVPDQVIGTKRSWDRIVPTQLKRGRWVAETRSCDSSDRKPAIKRKFHSDVSPVLKRVKNKECVAFNEEAPELPGDPSVKKKIELPEWEEVRHFVEQAQTPADREYKWIQFLDNFEKHAIQQYVDHNREDTFSSYIS